MFCYFFFFFQAEDGIRDDLVTGVQTCALPICGPPRCFHRQGYGRSRVAPLDAPGAGGWRRGARRDPQAVLDLELPECADRDARSTDRTGFARAADLVGSRDPTRRL